MNISLTPAMEKFVRAQVKSGMYGNASEVMREALRGMMQKFKATPAKKSAAAFPPEDGTIWPAASGTFAEEVQKGLDELERGEGIYYESIDDMFADIRRRARERRKHAKS